MRIKIVVILLLTLILGYFFWLKPKLYFSGVTTPMVRPVPQIAVMKMQKKQIQLFLELPARVASYKISEVRPQVDGIIKERKFVEGSFVEEGQQLYQIDPALLQASFDDVNASFKTIRAKKDRYYSLLKEDAISKQEYEDIYAQFIQADSLVKKAQTNLSYTQVLAPISGYIGKSNFTEGTLVTANQATVLTTITQLDPIYIDMVQPSRDMIKLGDQTEIAVSLLGDGFVYDNVGVLKFSEMFADASTDSVRLRAVFDNKDKKFIPGMFVRARLHLKPIEAISVPQKAASRGPNGVLTVWVVEDDSVHKREIKASQTSQDLWIVDEGLKEGDLVVLEGFQKLVDGAKIKPVFANVEEQKN